MVKSRKIIEILREIDVFGQPIQFYIKGKKLHTTAAGGIITLLMIAALLILFFVSFAHLINKTNVNLQEKTSYEMTPPLLDINRDNFMFSFGAADPTMGQNHSLFNYNLTLVTELNEEEEESKTIEQPIHFGLCDLNDYNKFADSKRIKSLSVTFCPKNFSFPIQGDEINNIHQYIRLNIVECVNGTHENITCAPPDEITKYFQSTQMVTFDLYFANRAIDPYDFNDPYKEFVDKLTWTISPLGTLSRISTISFRSMEIYSYDDIFGIRDPIIHKAAGFAQDRTDLSFIPLKNTKTYFDLYLKYSNYKKTCFVTYGSILQVISFIGGIFNLIHLFLGVIASQISNHIFEVMMANKMYSFDLSNVYEDEKKFDQVSEMREEYPPPDENDPSYWKCLIQKKFEKARLFRTSLIYPTLEYLKNSMCCLTKKSSKKRIFYLIWLIKKL